MLVVVVVFALIAVAESAATVEQVESNIVDALADAQAALDKEKAERASRSVDALAYAQAALAKEKAERASKKDALAEAQAALAKERAERARAQKVGNSLADVLKQETKALEEKSHEAMEAQAKQSSTDMVLKQEAKELSYEKSKETGLVERQTSSLDHCQMMLEDATKAATDEQAMRHNSESKVADLVQQVQSSISQQELAAQALAKTEILLEKGRKELATQKDHFVKAQAKLIKLNEQYVEMQAKMGASDKVHRSGMAELNEKVATLTKANALCMKESTSAQNEYKKQQKMFVMSSKLVKEQTVEMKKLKSELKVQTTAVAKLGEENKAKVEEEHGLVLELSAEQKKEKTAEQAVEAERKAFLGVKKVERKKMDEVKSAAKKEREEMEKNLASKQSELAKMMAEAKKHQADEKQLSANDAKLLEELSKTQADVHTLTEDNSNLQKTVTLNSGDLSMAEAKLDRDALVLSSTRVKLTKALKAEESVKDAKNKEDVELKQEIKILAETREDLSKTQKKLGNTESARDKLADSLHTAQADLSKAASRNNKLQKLDNEHNKKAQKFQSLYHDSDAASKKKDIIQDKEIKSLTEASVEKDNEKVQLKTAALADILNLNEEKVQLKTAMVAEAKILSAEVDSDKKTMKSQEAGLAKFAHEDREHQKLVKTLVAKEKDLKGTLLDLTAAEKLTKSNLAKEESRERLTAVELKQVKEQLVVKAKQLLAKQETSAEFEANGEQLAEEKKSIKKQLDVLKKHVASQNEQLKQKKEEVKGKDEEIEILSSNVEKVTTMLEQKMKEKKLVQETAATEASAAAAATQAEKAGVQAEKARQTSFDEHMNKLKRSIKVSDKVAKLQSQAAQARASARHQFKAEQRAQHGHAKMALVSSDGGALERETPQEANLNQALADSQDSTEAADKAGLAEFEA